MDSKKQSPNNEPTLRDHVYDGIQEYDQKLPNWWLFTLYIAIAWFVVHWLCYYQLGLGSSDTIVIDKAMAETDALLKGAPADPYFLELKGQILLESGKPAEALAALRALVNAGRDTFGDYCEDVSINGALLSGDRAAKAVIEAIGDGTIDKVRTVRYSGNMQFDNAAREVVYPGRVEVSCPPWSRPCSTPTTSRSRRTPRSSRRSPASRSRPSPARSSACAPKARGHWLTWWFQRVVM